MPAEELAEAFLTLIEDGQEIGQAVTHVTADNAAYLADMAEQVASAGNGIAEEVATVTETVEEAGVAVTTTTGLGLLTMEVPAAGAMIAPALGVLAGIGLYNLTPEFWNGVADSLVSAGQTIGGKVHAFFTSDGKIAFSQSTIEIIKDALLSIGYFDSSTIVPSSVYEQLPEVKPPLPLGATILQTTHSYLGGSYQPNTVTYVTSVPTHGTLYVHYRGTSYYSDEFAFVMSAKVPFTIKQYNGNGQLISTFDAIQRTFNNKTFYTSAAGGGTIQRPITTNIPINDYPFDNIFYLSPISVGYIVEYGEASNTDIQPGATYPDSRTIPQIYPDWQPISVPQYLPNPVYYPVEVPYALPDSEPAPSGGNAQQDGAQDPIPSTDPDWDPDKWIRWIIEKISIPEPNPDPYPDPEPAPSPDPDPQPEPEPVPEPDPEPAQEDPVDPNVQPEPDIVPVVPPVIPTTNSNRLFSVYNPTDAELDSLGGFLWDGTILEEISKIWQNPLDGIISLHKIYCTPTVGSSAHIILGKLDSSVSAALVTSQFATVDCGSVTIPENKKNVTDYSPYATVHIYLPFIGIMPLDVDEVMNSTLNVKYKVDVYTGTCLAEIYVTRSPDVTVPKILYTFPGNCAQMLPLTASTANGVFSTLAGVAATAIGVVSGGGALAAVAGAQALGHSLAHEMINIGHSGALSSNSGILGQRKPYVIIGRRQGYDANGYNEIYGYPTNKTIYLSNAVGYTKVKAINLQSSATQAEKAEITTLLKEGVIF